MIATVGFLAARAADAAQYVYPSQGQDRAKQASDEAQCWATQQTGFDPAKAQASGGVNALTGSPTDASALTGALGAMPGGMGGAGGATPYAKPMHRHEERSLACARLA
jgi:hypothetical protein